MQVSTISDTLGYTLDTYGTFVWHELLADEDQTDDTDIDDFGAYRKDLAELQADVLNDNADGVVQKFEHTGDYSPSYYNFSTDNSEIDVTLDYDKLKAYVVKNRPEFEQYLRDNFTSYDGFMSYVPNNYQDFFGIIAQGDDIERDRNIAIMAGWYFKRECLTDDEYLDAMYDRAYEIAYNHAINLAPQE